MIHNTHTRPLLLDSDTSAPVPTPLMLYNPQNPATYTTNGSNQLLTYDSEVNTADFDASPGSSITIVNEPDASGTVLRFPDTDGFDKIAIKHTNFPASLITTSNNCTVSVVYKRTGSPTNASANVACIFGTGGDGSVTPDNADRLIQLSYNDNNGFLSQLFDPSAAGQGAAFPLDTDWHHVVIRYAIDNKIDTFVDNTLIASIAIGSNAPDNIPSVFAGFYELVLGFFLRDSTFLGGFQGFMGHFHVYETPISDAEITSLYNSLRPLYNNTF